MSESASLLPAKNTIFTIMSKFFTAIGIRPDGTALKYRNIPNQGPALAKFESFIKNKGVAYVNYYDRENRSFVRRAAISKIT